MDEICSLKQNLKKKQPSQILANVDENNQQVNNGLTEELQIKIKLLENENKL